MNVLKVLLLTLGVLVICMNVANEYEYFLVSIRPYKIAFFYWSIIGWVVFLCGIIIKGNDDDNKK